MGLGVLREQADPQPGLANLHDRVLNAVDVDALVHHDPRDKSRNDLVADEDRHNCTGVPDDGVAPRLELTPHVPVVRGHLLPSLNTLPVPEDVELGQGGGCLDGVDAGCVREGVRHVPDQVDQLLVPRPHEADVCAQGLAAGPAHHDVGEIAEALGLPGAWIGKKVPLPVGPRWPKSWAQSISR